MQVKKLTGLLLLILCLSNKAPAQTVNHWQRIPGNSAPPQTLMHPLQKQSHQGEIFRLRYQTEPVTPMLRRIKHGFAELFATSIPKTEAVADSTQLLEEFDREAAEALALGYEDLDLSNDYSIFALDQDKDAEFNELATGSEPLADDLMLASAPTMLEIEPENIAPSTP